MKIYTYNTMTADALNTLCERENVLSGQVMDTVQAMSDTIRISGDSALKQYSKNLDKVQIDNFAVSGEELQNATIESDLENAIKTASDNIFTFHKQQVPTDTGDKTQTSQGVFCWQEFKPIDSVGLYIPSGSAPLFSTVLMLAIPAILAGCNRIAVCTPPNTDGTICKEILWTLNFLGITEVYKIGGAQAIFAMGYGTESIAKVDKIYGPGNAYVTAAKMRVSGVTAIDMPAGPSEVLIVADTTSNADFVAADILAQAEHGADSQAVLVCTSAEKIQQVKSALAQQLPALPRKDIAEKALQNSFIMQVETLQQAFEFSNRYAPEHLIIALKDYQKYTPCIRNAGSVFCGIYSAESFGDYASGTNHTLPTSGFAKSYSGINVTSFGKWITFQEITQQGLENLGQTVEILAEKETLFAHKNAVTIRKESL